MQSWPGSTSFPTGGAVRGVVPIWTKVITWAAGHCPDIGGTPFTSGQFDDNAGDRDAFWQAVAIHWAPDAAFPTDHLNVQKAPYKLQMTITSVNGATVRTRTRWWPKCGLRSPRSRT